MSDIFVRDRETGVTEIVSGATEDIPANDHSNLPAISADGRYVTFMTGADNLVHPLRGGIPGTGGIVLPDRETGRITGVSLSTARGTMEWTNFPDISADGGVVVFSASSPRLVGTESTRWIACCGAPSRIAEASTPR